MWRRWNNYGGNRGPSIGHPTLLETTVEEGYLQTIPEVDSLKSKRSSISTINPDLPIRNLATIQNARQYHKEPAWSQPSPTIPDYYEDTSRQPREEHYAEVSPISSPRRSNPDISREETPISPIDTEAPFQNRLPLPNHDQRSRIPQRIVSNRSKNVTQTKRETEETRWDTYSGEPTKEESGQLAAVRPGIQPLEHQYPQLKERTKQILAGIREREAANNTVSRQQPPPLLIPDPLDRVVHKEPWKGLSGRTALVDPVQNNPAARFEPLPGPQKQSEPVSEPVMEETAQSPAHTLRTVASEESIKPIAPLRIITKSRNTSPQSSQGIPSPPYHDSIQSAPPVYQHSKSLQSPFSSPGPVGSTDEMAPLSIIQPDSPPFDQAPDTPRTPTSPAQYTNLAPTKVEQMPAEPDVSRFSWTTYATSVQESPSNMTRILRSESPPPPMPLIPQLKIKKRPVSDAYAEGHSLRHNASPSQASIVVRKPVGSSARPRPSSGIAPSQLSLSKTLPQIPPEYEAIDKIANLEAQLHALAMRKHNTNRIVRDLNDSLKRNAIVYDQWKRKVVSDRISSHETELQSIANEEHDIGLLLHRAQKKRDKENNYETPTGLWIRRVTS